MDSTLSTPLLVDNSHLPPLYKHRLAKIERTCKGCARKFFVVFSQRAQMACSSTCSGFIRRELTAPACAHCGKETTIVNGVLKKFCNRDCWNAHDRSTTNPRWNQNRFISCTNCGKEFERGLKRERKNPMCSLECHRAWVETYGKSHRAPSGTTRNHIHGYIVVKMDDGSWAWQHRLVVEAHLGRKLESKEVIHHIDGDKKNNAIENLLVTNQSGHKKLHREAEKVGMKVMSGRFMIVTAAGDPCDREEHF